MTSRWDTRPNCGGSPPRTGSTPAPSPTNHSSTTTQRRQTPDGVRKPRASKLNNTLAGLLHCGICQRRMIGSFNNDRNNYRCNYPAEYADANRIAHPRSLYVREDDILEQLDPWLARALSPGRLTETVQAMADAQHNDADLQRSKLPGKR
ncbi:zinc ribbon domain-containing protein [Micromonospora musae]